MERLDSNYILNAIFQSGGTVDVREDSNFILNTVFDSTNNALKVGLSGDISIDAISASTIYSGGTDLYDIFLTSVEGNDITRVQPGTNITTGGTANEPIVNLADNVSVTNISATTFYSGSTELGSLFGNGVVSSVAAGDANIEVGGTAADPTVSLADSPSVNNLTASGTSEAAIITSGGTNLYSIFAPVTHAHAISDVTDLSLELAGKSATGHTHVSSEVTDLSGLLGTKANLSGASFTGAISVDGDATISGSLYVNGTSFSSMTEDVYVSANTITINSGEVNSGVTAGFAGLEIDRGTAEPYYFIFNETTDTFRVGETGTTQAVATREDVPTDNGIAYWDSDTNKFLTSTNVLSGATNIETLFATVTHAHAISDVTDLSLQLAGKSATGHTHVSSEVTDLGDLLGTKANLSGASFTGAITSGGTDLYNIFLSTEAHVGDVVSVAAEDANVTIGGTGANPTVGLADNVNVVNLSATTFYSGSTELSTLFGGSSAPSDRLMETLYVDDTLKAVYQSGNTVTGFKSSTWGSGNINSALNAHVEGFNNTCNADGINGHVSGELHVAGGSNITIEGYKNNASVTYGHIEGIENVAAYTLHHIEGRNNYCVGYNCFHVEGGYNTINGGGYSHIEGVYNNINSNDTCHVEGYYNTSNTSSYSHVEGMYNKNINSNTCHIGGSGNTVSGYISFINGSQNSIASGTGVTVLSSNATIGVEDYTLYADNIKVKNSISATTFYAGTTDITSIFEYAVSTEAVNTTPITGAVNKCYLANATDASITINLPAAASSTNKSIYVKKTDATVNTVTIDGNDSETIDGALTYVIGAQYDFVRIICDGSNWFIIG